MSPGESPHFRINFRIPRPFGRDPSVDLRQSSPAMCVHLSTWCMRPRPGVNQALRLSAFGEGVCGGGVQLGLGLGLAAKAAWGIRLTRRTGLGLKAGCGLCLRVPRFLLGIIVWVLRLIQISTSVIGVLRLRTGFHVANRDNPLHAFGQTASLESFAWFREMPDFAYQRFRTSNPYPKMLKAIAMDIWLCLLSSSSIAGVGYARRSHSGLVCR